MDTRGHRGLTGHKSDNGDTRAETSLKLKERYMRQKQVKVVYGVCHNASEILTV